MAEHIERCFARGQTMYEELVKRLRNCAELHGECALCPYQGNGCDAMPETPLIQAADAIEELQQQVEHYHGCMLEYKEAYIAEHDVRIAEAKRLYDAFYDSNKKAVEFTPLKIVLPEPPKEE